MVRKSSLMSKVLVLMMAFAVIFTYSVLPMNGAYAATKKPAQVKSLKVTAKAANSVTLKWKKAANAKSYQVYASTKKSGGYKKVATVKSSKKNVTKKVKNLKGNTKYYFKVRAINGKKKGKFSAVKTAKTKTGSVPAIDDRTVFVDADYVKALYDSGKSNVVIAEVSWGPDAPATLIDGAIHVNTDDLESNYQDLGYEFWDLRGFNNGYKELIAAMESYGITTDTELVCYGADPAGSAQTRLAMAALMLGVKKVRVLDGGVAAWGDKGYPMTKKAATPKKASFGRTDALHTDWVISTADMLKKVSSDSNFKLVSIRSYDEFIGKNSGYAYIDIAGEPKGAVWGHDTDDGSYYLDRKTVDTDKIAEYLKPSGSSTKNELAFYCGTGWRSTIPFLICYEEGIENMKLWDDGWYVYSGAYSDPWNYGDDTKKGGIDFDNYPVQIGDPANGSVTTTTVKALNDSAVKYNPLRGLSVNQATIKVGTKADLANNFSVMPSKRNIMNSVKFTSDDPSVTVDPATGRVKVNSITAGKKVTISAEPYATVESTPDKSGKPSKDKVSYTIEMVNPGEINYVGMSDEEWANYGITSDELKSTDFLLDVRKANVFLAGYLKGSVNSPVSNPYSDDEKTAVKAVYDAHSSADRIVIICNSGNMLAKNAMAALKDAGADMGKVVYLIGGAKVAKDLDDWYVPDFINMDDAEWATYGIEPGTITNSDYIIDVRPDAKRSELGYVPGAAIVANSTDGDALKAAYDKHTGSRVVIICNSGNTLARNAMDALKAKGVDMSTVTYLKGGFNSWSENYPVVSPDKKSVSVPAWVKAGPIKMIEKEDGSFAEDLTHHVLVNENGGNAAFALLNTKALPLQVYNALADIGGTPCDKFNRADCFDANNNPLSVFLPKDAQKVNVSFTYEVGSETKTATMSDFFDHVKTATAEVKKGTAIETEAYEADMRFGGCMENITQNFDKAGGNQTGCITCTFSCWIGQVSNAAYAYNTQEAKVNRDKVPADNTPVKVVYTLVK